MNTALVAICCNEPNISEWVKFHLKLGFNAMQIALNNCSKQYVEHCRSLDIDNVFFTEFNPPESPLAPQFIFYNSWINVFGKHFDFAAFLDVDEYLYLGGKTLPEFLQGHLDSPVTAINWKYFASPEENPEGPSDSLLQRFTYSQRGKNKHVKPLANLKRCYELNLDTRLFFVNPHLISHPASQLPTVDECGTQVIGPYNQKWTDNDIFVAHFYSKTRAEFAAKIQRGRPDCARSSSAQYFRREQAMWEEYNRCHLPEEKDTRLINFLERNLNNDK